MWDRNLARIDWTKRTSRNCSTSSSGWLGTIFGNTGMSLGSTTQTCGLKRNDAMKMSSAGAMSSWSCAISWKPGKPTNRPRTAPFSSTMWEQEIRNLCKKLKPLLGKRADALWTAYITAETPRSTQEAEALIQLLAAQYLSPTSLMNRFCCPRLQPRLPPANFCWAPCTTAQAKLQPALSPAREFHQAHRHLLHHRRGQNQRCRDLASAGLAEPDVPFLVLDWKRAYGQLRSLPLEKAKKITVYSVGRKGHEPFNWNPFRGPPGVHPKTWISAVAEALEKFTSRAQVSPTYLLNCSTRNSRRWEFTMVDIPCCQTSSTHLATWNIRGSQGAGDCGLIAV